MLNLRDIRHRVLVSIYIFLGSLSLFAYLRVLDLIVVVDDNAVVEAVFFCSI